jgi:peptide/nickel transport system permease protein
MVDAGGANEMGGGMRAILRKCLNSFITVVLVTVLNFFLFRVMPGSPLARLQGNTKLSETFKQKLIDDFGLDQPMYVQFVEYIKHVLTLDFGNSFKQPLTPALDIILDHLKWTLVLTGTSSVFMIVIGMTIGIYAAWKRGKSFDTGSMVFSLFFYAMPTFWFAMMLVVVFATELTWFPSYGAMPLGEDLEFTWTSFTHMLYHLTLPAVSLTLGSIAAFSLIMRGSLIDVMTEDYIITAKAKGLTDKQVLRHHAVPNAMLPMVALIAIDLAFVVGGAFQTEFVFDYPGIGMLLVDATFEYDYPLLEGAFFIIAVVVIIANLVADTLLVYMDPRIKEV